MNIFLKLLLFIPACCLWIWAFIIEPHIILDVEEVPIKIEKWDSNLDNLKIAVVGDIHAGKPFFEDWRVKKIVDKITSLSPDIVLLVGDFVNGGWYQSSMNLDKLASMLSKIRAPFGVYAILGNHDYLYGAGQIRKMINSTHIKLLENSNAKVDTPKGSFYISGIADPLSATRIRRLSKAWKKIRRSYFYRTRRTFSGKSQPKPQSHFPGIPTAGK